MLTELQRTALLPLALQIQGSSSVPAANDDSEMPVDHAAASPQQPLFSARLGAIWMSL